MRQFVVLGIMVVGALAIVYATATIIETSETSGHRTDYGESVPPR
jgi:hypothetical protein